MLAVNTTRNTSLGYIGRGGRQHTTAHSHRRERGKAPIRLGSDEVGHCPWSHPAQVLPCASPPTPLFPDSPNTPSGLVRPHLPSCAWRSGCDATLPLHRAAPHCTARPLRPTYTSSPVGITAVSTPDLSPVKVRCSAVPSLPVQLLALAALCFYSAYLRIRVSEPINTGCCRLLATPQASARPWHAR